MQYFAIGEDNGGAGERRLGPFDTAEEAQAAGQRETKDSNGGFIFRGIVDEANNQVFAIGDVALNAKGTNADKGRYKVEEYNERGIQKTTYWDDFNEAKYYAHDSHYARIIDTSTLRVVASYGDLENRDVLKPISNSVRTSCSVVANAIVANRRVARNAITVEEQREFQKTKLPKIEAEVNAYVKEADSIYSQVMAALKKADGIASTVSALEKKAEKLVKSDRYSPVLGVFDFDETKAKSLYAKMDAAYRKIVECRDKASEIGYGLVNSFRAY